MLEIAVSNSMPPADLFDFLFVDSIFIQILQGAIQLVWALAVLLIIGLYSLLGTALEKLNVIAHA